MALIVDGVTATYTFRDNNGKESTCSFRLPTGIPVADTVTAAESLVALLTPLSNAALVRYSISRDYFENTPPTPAVESEVERKLTMTFRAGTGQTVIVNIPSPIFGLEIPNTDIVNQANPALQALIDAVVNGIGGVQFVSNAESNIVAYEGPSYIKHVYRRRK